MAQAGEGEVVAHVTGGTKNSSNTYTYDWSHDALLNDSTASNLLAGWYKVTATDDHGCFLVDSMEILEPGKISINLI